MKYIYYSWMQNNKHQYIFSNELAIACCENYGLWEDDIGYDGKVHEFAPKYLIEAAEKIVNEKH